MLKAKLKDSALISRMIRKAELIAEARGRSQSREAKWRSAEFLWPLFNRD